MMRFAFLFAVTAAALAADIEAPPDKPGLQIKADFAIVDLKTNIVFYSNNVVVVDSPAKPGDPPTVLKCHELRAKRGTNSSIEWIIAEGNVLIDQGQMHAGAERAVYTGETEQIELTGGKPFLITSGVTNYGTVIVYDRRNETLSIKKVLTTAAAALMSKPGVTNSSGTNQPASTNRSKRLPFSY